MGEPGMSRDSFRRFSREIHVCVLVSCGNIKVDFKLPLLLFCFLRICGCVVNSESHIVRILVFAGEIAVSHIEYTLQLSY